MGYYVDEIKTVSKYAVINFKDSDDTVFKAVRCMLNETVDLPIIMTDMDGIIDPITFDKTYTFTGGWKDSSNQTVTNVIASGPDDYFADIYNLQMYYVAVMETETDGSQGMIADLPFKIYSNKKIFLPDVNYGVYIIRPSIEYSYDSNGDIINGVTFTIDNLVDNPGQITSLEPEFKVYKDINLAEEIGTVKFEVRVYHSSEQPTGD